MKTEMLILKNKMLAAFALLVAMCAVSCEDDNHPAGPGDAPDDGYYFVIASADEVVSRSMYDNITTTRFADGDILGAFALNSDGSAVAGQRMNVAYRVVTKTNIDPEAEPRQVLEAVDASEALDKGCTKYLFYYPYDPYVTSLDALRDYSLTVSADQSGISGNKENGNYEKSDLLWDVAVPDPDRDCVNIAMDHAMANIIVEIDEKLLDVERGVRLQGMRLNATGIDLATSSVEDMRYDVAEEREPVTMWDFSHSLSGLRQYRAVVPACVILTAQSELIRIEHEGKEKIFRLKSDMALEPGKNYIFRIHSSPGDKPIPDVTEDDSWVLDVLDPETGGSVGVLCREYIRFQPQLLDDIMDYESFTGKPAVNPDGTPTKVISSQAWVFYSLKDKVNKIPDLNTGTVLRFIYDVNTDYNGKQEPLAMQPVWPAPHQYGGNGIEAQGFFLSDHGHHWADLGGFGGSSAEWTENFMHGGTIHWAERTGSVEGIYSVYHYISQFDMPQKDGMPLEITNRVAYDYGHIAIDADGEAFVSYAGLTDDSHNDLDGNKVGVVIPHYLVDRRRDGDGYELVKNYPLVKIGYNDFWMSKNLTAKTLNDGTPLECYNSPGATDHVSFRRMEDELAPGYLYSHIDGTVDGETVYHDCYTNTMEGSGLCRQSVMYNTKVLRTGKILPISSDSRLLYDVPMIEDMKRIMMYFGRYYAGKLLGNESAYRSSQMGYLEPLQQALDRHGNITDTYTAYTANVSGFNLLPLGRFIYNTGFTSPSGQNYSLWLGDGEGNECNMFRLMAHHAWNSTPGIGNSNGTSQIETNNIAWSDAQFSQIFAPIRFLVKFKDQDDTPAVGRRSVPGSSVRKTRRSSADLSRDVFVNIE